MWEVTLRDEQVHIFGGVGSLIKAIVFDFDGLILDTETPEFHSFQAMYRDYGVDLSIDVWGQCVGTDGSMFEPYHYLEQSLGRPIDRDAARRIRKERYAERMREEQPRPGVTDYLRHASRLDLKVGLASSSTRQWVTGYLQQYELLHEFNCIRTKDDVPKVKPDPALYLQVLEGLGVRPEEAIAFEDSPNGALAAKRAGMYCVIVPNSITRLLTFGDYDMCLDSMSEMPLDEVISRIEQLR